MLYFPVAIIPEDQDGYGGVVPDLPGCFSVGDTFNEAIANAQEAIECHAEGMMMDDEPLASITSIEKHRHHQDYTDATWVIIPLDLTKISGNQAC